MKRIGVAGLCLVGMLAFCAMVSPAAQAAEITSCVKAAKVKVEYEKPKGKKVVKGTKEIREGKYKNSACTEPAPENTGKYPPYAGPEGKFEKGAAGADFSTKSVSSPKPKLELGGHGVYCTASAGKGEWTGAKTGVETVVFKGCALNDSKDEKCTTSGLKEGEIESSPLDLTLISYPEELMEEYFGPANEKLEESHPWHPPEGEVFVESSVAAGYTYYMEYTCAPGVSFRTEGSVAGRVTSKVNAMGKKMQWNNAPGGAGIEDLRSEKSVSGGPWTPVGWNTYETYEPVATDKGGIEVIEPGVIEPV